MISSDSHIAIIGGGAWGLSTALHLRRSGYTKITVFERSESIPSPYSAAWDLNKIVRAEYEDKLYSKLALEAIEAWKTPLFSRYYHQTGYIVATTDRAPRKATDHLEKALASIQSDPVFAPGIRRLHGPNDFKTHMWQLSGPMTGFSGYYNSIGGYAHSSDTLKGVWAHCTGLGVKFIMGKDKGKVTNLVYSGANKCEGLKTNDGNFHATDLTICAAGAHNGSILPGVGRFAVARCWSVAHVQLTEEEADFLRGIPTTNVRDLGFFFEPDPKTRLFKLCPLGAGYTNTHESGISLPPVDPAEFPQDYIPTVDEEKLRKLLRETFPWMAKRPFVQKKMCWFSDTSNSDFCIDFEPGTHNSVISLCGDSGHGFKMMPILGRRVVQLIENDQQDEPRWKWPTPTLARQDWAEAVSWRIGQGGELRDLDDGNSSSLHSRL